MTPATSSSSTAALRPSASTPSSSRRTRGSASVITGAWPRAWAPARTGPPSVRTAGSTAPRSPRGASPRQPAGLVPRRDRLLPDEVGRAAGRAVEQIAQTDNQLLRTTARDAGRDLPLIAIPVLGTAGGGHDLERGLVIDALLADLTTAAREHGVDVALVASSRSDYSALQHRRRASGRASLPDAHLARQAQVLGDRAARGDLALFFGAGVSIAAGLPSWSALLEKLVEAMHLDIITAKDFQGLGSLEQAELLQVTLAKRSGGTTRLRVATARSSWAARSRRSSPATTSARALPTACSRACASPRR
ncbi:hypothetical protein NKG05_11130 [Oerskovia sp. M15]